MFGELREYQVVRWTTRKVAGGLGGGHEKRRGSRIGCDAENHRGHHYK